MNLLCTLFGITCVTFVAGADPVTERARLCVDGHPARRTTDITYAHLPPRPHMQRDHIVPLCLGGADTADNLQYQSTAAARTKDEREWRACENYCAGRVDLKEVRTQFKRHE